MNSANRGGSSGGIRTRAPAATITTAVAASTTPPWNPPPGVSAPCAITLSAITVVGPASAAPTTISAGEVRGRRTSSGCSARSGSPRWWRSSATAAIAAANTMNSSTSVSTARTSNAVNVTVFVAARSGPAICATIRP